MLDKRLLILCLLSCANAGASSEPEIYRCAQADGTLAFQQTPCRPAATSQPDNTDKADPSSGKWDGSSGTADRRAPGPTIRPATASASPTTEFASTARTDSPDAANATPSSSDTAPISGDRADCEKATRNAIDEIDAKLQKSVAPENDRAHLRDLLQLTRKLRRCKQL